MSTNVKVTDHRTIAIPTFGQLAIGQWFIDDMDNLCCKVDVDEAFMPNHGMAAFCDEDEATVVEEIQIEIIK